MSLFVFRDGVLAMTGTTSGNPPGKAEVPAVGATTAEGDGCEGLLEPPPLPEELPPPALPPLLPPPEGGGGGSLGSEDGEGDGPGPIGERLGIGVGSCAPTGVPDARRRTAKMSAVTAIK